MGQDAPVPNRFEKPPAIVKQVSVEIERKLLEDVFPLPEKIQAAGRQLDPRMKPFSRGAIESMLIPAGWEKDPDEGGGFGMPGVYGIMFYVPDSQKPGSDNGLANLTMYYRGHSLGATATSNFADILKKSNDSGKPYHQLTPIELKGIEELLEGQGSYLPNYTLLAARTETINGKRLLFVEGIYNKTKRNDQNVQIARLTIYVDADADKPGSTPQEIDYRAISPELFTQYMPEVEKSLSTIRWSSWSKEPNAPR